jgi:hypothetical protein
MICISLSTRSVVSLLLFSFLQIFVWLSLFMLTAAQGSSRFLSSANQQTGIELSTKLCLGSAASSVCESLVIVIFLPLLFFSSVFFLLENPAQEQ